MAKPAGLIQKKSAYFYVRRIPANIKHMFGNKTQITIPLGTSDFRVAANRARAKAAEVDLAFQNAKLGIKTNFSQSRRISIEVLEAAARLHLYDLECAERKAELTTDYEMEAREVLMHLENPYDDWASTIHTSAYKLASKHSLPIEPGDAFWGEYIHLVHRAETEHYRRRIDRARRAHTFKVRDRLFEAIHDGNVAPALASEASERLAAVIAYFEQDPHRTNLTESAGKKYIIPLAVLREVVGEQIPIGSITRSQCSQVLDLIAQLPSNYTKIRELRNKTFAEIVELSKAGNYRKLSHSTVVVYANHLSAFFNYAVQKGICQSNPASKLISNRHGSRDTKKPFCTTELQALIQQLPDWCGREKNGYFWLPMIALFSGMRLGEIVWLKAEDVVQQDGVTTIALTKTSDRSLKTPGATRTIPVHPELLKLGFLDLIHDSPSRTNRLFPELTGDTQIKAVDHFQKRFSYWARTKLKVRPGVSFHSFRHTFRDATREAELPIDSVRALGGWARGSGIEERYGQGARVKKLNEWMSRITYPELDLGPLSTF